MRTEYQFPAISVNRICYRGGGVTTPLVLVVGMLTEILSRALAGAVRVVVGVFALGALLALLDLFLTHT